MAELCPICKSRASVGLSPTGEMDRDYDCPRCGSFRIGLRARAVLQGLLSNDQKTFARLSHSVRRASIPGTRFEITVTNIDELANARLPLLLQQLDNLMRWLASDADDDAHHVSELDYDYLAGIVGTIGGAQVEDVADALVKRGLAEHIPDNCIKLTAYGWMKVEELNAGASVSPPTRQPSAAPAQFVDSTRLDALRSLPTTKFHFARLIQMCEELNSAWASENWMSVAMLTRAILDHVPPVFGATSFAQFVNNGAGLSRSSKESLLHLENLSRKIADGMLHSPITKKASVPTQAQVNCVQAMDVLLGEVIDASA